ncbi:MAG: matrixin family metalloprotease [Actinomycetota bacterium]
MSTEDHARERYDEMMRQLEELDRIDGIDLTTWPITARSEAASLIVRRAGIVLATMIGIVLALAFVGDRAGAATRLPPLPDDAQTTRVLPAVSTAYQGAHNYMSQLPNGAPVTYDPCRPLHYVVNTHAMPSGGLDVVRRAIDQVSDASGLRFIEDGQTSETPRDGRPSRQPDLYGDRWAPILIGWTDESRFPQLAGTVAGVGGSIAITPSGAESTRYVTGQIALDTESFTGYLSSGQADAAQAVVTHELGHVLGLAHVQDATHLMHHMAGALTFSPGDLQGLAAVGAGRCHQDT